VTADRHDVGEPEDKPAPQHAAAEKPASAGVATAEAPILKISGLTEYFPVRRGFLQRVVGYIKAVDGVDLEVRRGETLGLVGESGCGKSTLGRAILRLVEPTSGTITFDGVDFTKVPKRDLKPFRKRMQMVFQDPVGSLNPRMAVGDIIGEALLVHGMRSRSRREQAVRDILKRVGLRPEYTNRYPHEFSGGQRQRIGIARALILQPELVVADEPVSALDVSIQSQVLNLLVDLKREFGLTYIFVAHNLAVVAYISDRIAVMYLGKIVELAESQLLYRNPLHPYTQALLSAIPMPDPDHVRNQIVVSGDVPSPFNPPSGCHFRTRCPLAKALGTQNGICAEQEPPLEEKEPGHLTACHFARSQHATEKALEDTKVDLPEGVLVDPSLAEAAAED
jgi:oligopeptide/dipeptide ABC transporter ATP-binding protein